MKENLRSVFQERDLGRKNRLFVLAVTPVLFTIFALVYAFFDELDGSISSGLIRILISPTLLITDFFAVGGVAATLLNAAFIGFFNLFLLWKYKMRINGLLIAAYFTVVGFSFFGKNIINIIPIYFGGWLYSRYQKIPYSHLLLINMFATALSPMVSTIAFADMFENQLFALLLAIVIGVFAGFVIMPLSSHMIKFHDGYNLYNVGFTSGIIGIFATSGLKSFGKLTPSAYILDENGSVSVALLVCLVFAVFIVAGLITNPNAIKDYRKILVFKGRTVTDFTSLVGYGITFLNMGLMGLLSIGFVFLMGGSFNGPVFAGIFAVSAFSAFGKHPLNTYPVVLGVVLAGVFIGYHLSATTFLIAALFSTTLAPVTGHYGPFAGLMAGFMHLLIVTHVGIVHGGLNLYNNGFAGGIVAGFFVPLIDTFKRK